jgi:hypothetical protein
VSRRSSTHLVKYQLKAFLCAFVNIKRLTPEFTVASLEDLEEDEDCTDRLNLIVVFSSFLVEVNVYSECIPLNILTTTDIHGTRSFCKQGSL